MASAGVVGFSEVVVPNSTNTGSGMSLGKPFSWSMIWVALAFLFLVWVHVQLLRRG